jgi:hypothetical protein
MRRIIVVLAAIATIALLGFFHYDSCIVPGSSKDINLFLTQSRTCQLPGLIYELIEDKKAPKEK